MDDELEALQHSIDAIPENRSLLLVQIFCLECRPLCFHHQPAVRCGGSA
jgi:hypothetical protein